MSARAAISDHHARASQWSVPLYITDELAFAAVDEARTLLARTEPQRISSSYDTYFGEGPALEYRMWPTGGRQAMVEALADALPALDAMEREAANA